MIAICVHMCKMISLKLFSFFENFNFLVFRELKGQKMIQNYQFQTVKLSISGTVDHIMIQPVVYYFFKKMQHCKYFFFFFFRFFIGSLQQFFKLIFVFKFISKGQKEILRCALTFSHLSDFFQLGCTPHKGEQPLQGMELQGKETQKD